MLSDDPGQARIRIERQTLDACGKRCRRPWAAAAAIEQIHPILLVHGLPEVGFLQAAPVFQDLDENAVIAAMALV